LGEVPFGEKRINHHLGTAKKLVRILFALVFFCIVVGALLVDLLVLVLEISTNIIEGSGRRTHTNQALFL
jgi:hypothetical protein